MTRADETCQGNIVLLLGTFQALDQQNKSLGKQWEQLAMQGRVTANSHALSSSFDLGLNIPLTYHHEGGKTSQRTKETSLVHGHWEKYEVYILSQNLRR
jgi:hypothetical protein